MQTKRNLSATTFTHDRSGTGRWWDRSAISLSHTLTPTYLVVRLDHKHLRRACDLKVGYDESQSS